MDWNVEWNDGMDLYYHIATQTYMVEQQIADKFVLTLFHTL